jgi:NitT/TauT family transport system permease protein
VLAVVFLLWGLYVRIGRPPVTTLPSPVDTIAAAIKDAPTLLSHSLVTISEIILGFAASAMIGIPMAVTIDRFAVLEGLLYPYLIATQVIPVVAIAPLIVIWLGYGLVAKVFIVALFGIFAVVIETLAGLRSLEIEKEYLARSMGASTFSFYSRIKLPQALPSIFEGLKISATLSVVGAVVSEFVSSRSGLGHYIIIAESNFNAVKIFSAVIYLAIIGIAFFALISALERLLLPWHSSQRLESAHGS